MVGWSRQVTPENSDPPRIVLPKHLFSPQWVPGNAQSEKRVPSPLRTCSRTRQQRRRKRQPTFHPSLGTVCPRSKWPAEPWKNAIVAPSAQSPVEASSARQEIRHVISHAARHAKLPLAETLPALARHSTLLSSSRTGTIDTRQQHRLHTAIHSYLILIA